jgi:hypothetical protein
MLTKTGEGMAKYYSASQFGERVDLPHNEVIRRIRRGDINAQKLGWNWLIHEGEVERVKDTEWYRRTMKRRRARERNAV